MSEEFGVIANHPLGESQDGAIEVLERGSSLDTFAGKIHLRWVDGAAVSSMGQMPYFIEFLKTSGRFDEWVNDCPLCFSSSNAPRKRDVLGTILLSVVAGHWRYAHMNSVRGDGVNPELLGMTKVCSEDSVRRAAKAMAGPAGQTWLRKHLKESYEPLLDEPWILDVDTTVKLLYGHQEDARVGYNPTKPGRPSHALHSYFIANIRIAVDVEVQAGNQTASSFAQPQLWSFLDGLAKQRHPSFLRGDSAWGTERAMEAAEQRQIPFLFKLKQSANVRRLAERLLGKDGWVDAGQGWQGMESELRLSGWSKTRRVMVLRRPLPERAAEKARKAARRKEAKQLTLDLNEARHQGERYEYAVLVTSLKDEVLSIAQHYRDRADSENNFDELKNQWGWGGFTTQDQKRCQLMARITALIYNWWTIFMRLGIPDKHAEAITSRPLALQGIARMTRHANQTTVEVTSTHSMAASITKALVKVSGILHKIKIKAIAEQLTHTTKWRLILSAAFLFFLRGRILGTLGRLAINTG